MGDVRHDPEQILREFKRMVVCPPQIVWKIDHPWPQILHEFKCMVAQRDLEEVKHAGGEP